MKLLTRSLKRQGEVALRAGRPLHRGPSGAQVEVERPMWGPNPDPLRGYAEDHFWLAGSRFLHRFSSLVMGESVAFSKAETPKPPEWGEVMRLFEKGGNPEKQLASWETLIDGFAHALLPAKTVEEIASVWTLRTSLLTSIEDRIKAIQSADAWDAYFHKMPPSQQHIAAWTKARGAQFVTKLSAGARQKALDILIEGQMQGLGQKALSSIFLERMGELNRDWRRISITETAMAISNGQLASVADQGNWEAVWVGGPHACPFCRKMFGRVFEIVPRPKPGMDPEKFIWPGKHNVGRSMHLFRKDGTKRGPEELWHPCVPAHPLCCCLWSIRRRLTNQAAQNAEKILAGLRKSRYVNG